MCFSWGVLSAKPVKYNDFLVQVSPSLSEGVMEKSWESEVQAPSQLSSIPNFPITMEISKFPPRLLALKFTFHVPRLGF
jgi:hypothetical protein